MKKVLIIFMALIALASCTSKNGNNTVTIKGEANELNGQKLYLIEGSEMDAKVKDSAEVKNNVFTFIIKNAKPQIYSISPGALEPGLVFVSGTEMNVKLLKYSEEGLDWEVKGSPMHEKYAKFLEEGNKIRRTRVIDSLDALFEKAREKDDDKELGRIKDISIPYYEEAEKKYVEFINKQVELEKGNIFGLYVYYRNVFLNKFILTDAEVEAERKYLATYDADAQNSVYMEKIKEKLVRLQNCAVGHQAPEITGADTTGKPVKLSDFKGKYVLVDFWNSYCTWCRKETPTMMKAYNKYKNKNFTILGVSSDRKKSDWITAIHEDKSYWPHLMMEEDENIAVEKAYCITGIPHIILVDPNGKILAKELRGEELIKAVENNVK